MTKTIVTGASGFIGSHLMKRLPDAKAINHDEVVLHTHSFGDCGQLFFLSTYGNMAHHKDYLEMVAANVFDLLMVVRSLKGWMCYMSSSSVTLPVQTPYSRTKRAAEEILQALPELKSCIVRPYSVTGVGEQKEHLIPTLIRSCMEGEEMPFVPWPQHDFVDVEDVVNALLWFADNESTGTFEIGNGLPYPNQTVLEMVEQCTGKKANIKTIKTLREYDTYDWYKKTGNSIGNLSRKPLEQSITEMVEDYKSTH